MVGHLNSAGKIWEGQQVALICLDEAEPSS